MSKVSLCHEVIERGVCRGYTAGVGKRNVYDALIQVSAC